MFNVRLFFLLVFCCTYSHAEPQRFNFNNPTFGGNPFVANHLFNLANKQYIPDKRKDTSLTELESFAEQIRRRTLSSVSSAIAANISGLSIDDLTDENGVIKLDGIEITYYQGENCNIILELAGENDEEIILDIPDFSCGSD